MSNAVSAAEIERWVEAVYDLDGTDYADAFGGVAPKTIAEHCESDRTTATVYRHLQRDDRVDSTYGVVVDGRAGGRRTSFVPARESFVRLVADGEGQS